MLTERTSYRPKPGLFDKVVETRIRACAIRQGLGLPRGDILIETPFEAGADRVVHWSQDFADEAAQQADLDARADSPAFRQIRDEMHELIDGFSRSLFRKHAAPGCALRDVSLAGQPIVPFQMTYASDGRDLTGYLYLPPGEGPFPCLVVNHGSGIFQGTSDLCRPGTATTLMSWGLAVFMPHRRGYGNSPGTPWREDVSAEFGTDEYDTQLAKRLAEESRDVIAARAYVATLPEIDASRIGVIGSSFGGTVTLLAAAEEPKFRCAVEFAGAAMNWDRTPGLRALMHAAAARLTQPCFFVQAENDYSIRPTLELAAGLEGSGKEIQHRVFASFGISKDEGHFLFGQGAQIWGPDVREFLERWL